MLLGRIGLLLSGELLKGADYAESCVARLDDIIDIAIACSLIRVAEEVIVFSLLLLGDACFLGRVLDGLYVLGVKDFTAPSAPITAMLADGHA